ncbi:protein adenylyltransferase SelO [Microvirga guangxiensis]|uniref:Protein nucleotidyltransferase YdiU n=1 Tax=Microvirga guangxiensis TaxID=549386 RepID=A0A1G5IAD1_9HYPH|nr:YdiU family protein [Microvirga guangxiensis]SCY72954.1 Uncharacterized conserved protein YdiU, UPF0061 family [Microvirga guangxiensis]
MSFSPAYRASKSHQALGADFYDIVAPAQFPTHLLRYRNQRWAARTGLEDLTDDRWVKHFGLFEPLPGSFEQPLALRYHGHQFRTYNPHLGDGRGFLFAQLYDTQDGRLLDLATKGSGQTPWSRHADGRLTLKGGVREVLATEMLEALGVNTSKSFSLIETGEELERGDEPSPTRSSVLVRLSHSHIRIGTFQRFLYLDEVGNIGRLLDYTITTYMPELWRESAPERASAFLEEVCRRVARMGAEWMAAGFVHGVLNTDNINVTGESFDYGPWRFLPAYDPAFTAAYFDETGLYAFGRQPDALLWNLYRLAECFLPIAEQSKLEASLSAFQPALHQEFPAAILRRLGLRSHSPERDAQLARSLWAFLHNTKAPFEQTFFDWYGGVKSLGRAGQSPSAAFYAHPTFQDFRDALEDFEPVSRLKLDHPYFARLTPCTMLIDDVEAIWEPIASRDDWTAFRSKLEDIRTMSEAYAA